MWQFVVAVRIVFLRTVEKVLRDIEKPGNTAESCRAALLVDYADKRFVEKDGENACVV